MGDEGAKLLEVDLLKALIGPQAKPDLNLFYGAGLAIYLGFMPLKYAVSNGEVCAVPEPAAFGRNRGCL